jgi:molybdopterin synthase catalytic subunit
MRVTVRLFGQIREAAGARELAVELPDAASASTLRALLAERIPAFGAPDTRLRVSVNRAFAADDAPLADGDEVAFLPPVSGGSGGGVAADACPPARCTISDGALDPAQVSARVAGPDAGGLVTFVGAVRDHARGHAIERLEYEAYPEMAIQEMDRICDEAARRWPGTRVAIAHRVGALGIGDLAVVIAAASAHRAEAFDACRFAIDELKKTVPIWKKEIATNGAYWVDDHA